MIYFWNDKQLARDLKNRIIPEKEKFIYFAIYVFALEVLQLIVVHTHYSADAAVSRTGIGWLDWITLLGSLLLFYLFYKTNAKGDDVNYIERYICLTIPLYIRLLVFATPIILLAVLKHVYLFSDYFGIIAILFFLYYVTRFTYLLKIASGQVE